MILITIVLCIDVKIVISFMFLIMKQWIQQIIWPVKRSLWILLKITKFIAPRPDEIVWILL